jgi:hypothetical protein
MITTFSMSSYQFIFLVQNFAKMKKKEKNENISHKISISSEKNCQISKQRNLNFFTTFGM